MSPFCSPRAAEDWCWPVAMTSGYLRTWNMLVSFRQWELGPAAGSGIEPRPGLVAVLAVGLLTSGSCRSHGRSFLSSNGRKNPMAQGVPVIQSVCVYTYAHTHRYNI